MQLVCGFLVGAAVEGEEEEEVKDIIGLMHSWKSGALLVEWSVIIFIGQMQSQQSSTTATRGIVIVYLWAAASGHWQCHNCMLMMMMMMATRHSSS